VLDNNLGQNACLDRELAAVRTRVLPAGRLSSLSSPAYAGLRTSASQTGIIAAALAIALLYAWLRPLYPGSSEVLLSFVCASVLLVTTAALTLPSFFIVTLYAGLRSTYLSAQLNVPWTFVVYAGELLAALCGLGLLSLLIDATFPSGST